MPRTNPEEYREYMRTYMRKKRGIPEENYKKKGEKKEMEAEDIGKVAKAGIDLAKEFGDKENDEGKEFIGKAEKYIGIAEKYAPIILKGIQGFMERQQEITQQKQAEQAQQTQVTIQTPPPIGWTEMSPLQRLGKKYTNPTWYQQGNLYEQEKKLKGQPQQLQAHAQNIQQAQTIQQPQPTTLKDLEHKHPEPPLIKDDQPTPNEPTNTAGMTDQEQEEYFQKYRKAKEQGNKEQFEEKEKNNSKENTKKEEPKEDDKMEVEKEFIEQLRKDNEIYLKKAFEFINDMPNKQMIQHIEEGKLFETFLKFKDFIPTQTKQMILTIDKKYLTNIIQQSCKEKWSYLKEKGKQEELLTLFDKIKEQIQKE